MLYAPQNYTHIPYGVILLRTQIFMAFQSQIVKVLMVEGSCWPLSYGKRFVSFIVATHEKKKLYTCTNLAPCATCTCIMVPLPFPSIHLPPTPPPLPSLHLPLPKYPPPPTCYKCCSAILVVYLWTVRVWWNWQPGLCTYWRASASTCTEQGAIGGREGKELNVW